MKYKSQITNNGLVSVSDVVSDKYDNIHKQLYEDALYRYIQDQILFSLATSFDMYNPDDYTYIEMPDEEYQKPSSIYVVSKKYPFTKTLVSLEPYWNLYQQDLQDGSTKNINDIMLDNETLKDAKIIYVDYVRGYATLYSKTTDRTFTVDFDYLTKYTPVDKYECTLYDTFMFKLRKKILNK